MSDAYNGSIDTELQVRLMNLVMGEASDFERDQLQLLMEQRAEVAAYYQHLEHLHGLLCEVGAGDPTINVDPASPAEDWQLPADRRAQVLAVLDSQKSPSQPDKVVLANKSKPKRWRMSAAQIAVIALSACVLIGLMLPAVQSARESARRVALGRRGMQLGLATLNDFQPQPSMDLMMDTPESGSIEKDLVSGIQHDVQSTVPAKPGADTLEEEPVQVATIPGFATAKNLGAALGRALGKKDSSQQLSNSPADEEAVQQREAAFQRMRESGMFGGGGGGRSNFGSFARGGEASSPSSPTADSLAAGNDKPSSSEDFIAEKSVADGNAAVANTNSGESLSITVAGQTLPSPYYLYDDVQHFPAGENKLPNETAAAKVGRAESAKGVADNMRWSDGGVANSLSSTVESPRPEVALGENAGASNANTQPLYSVREVDGEVPYSVAVPATNGVEQSYTMTVPNGDSAFVEDPKTGRILLGGIIHTNESVDGRGSEGKAAEATGPAVDNGRFNNNTWDRGDASAWMMTVTPSIVVPEEEEVRYTDDTKAYRQVPAPVGDFMVQQDDAEGEVVAKQVELPALESTAGLRRDYSLDVEYEADKDRQDRNFIKALNDVEAAATPINEPTILYPDAKTWEALSNRRKERYGDVSTSGKSAAETADFDSLQGLVEKTIDPNSWQEAGGNNASNAYPAKQPATSAPAENGKYPPNLSIALSAPQDGTVSNSNVEASKDIAPEVVDDGSSFMKWVTPKEQPSDENGNGLFGDVQVEFIEEIDLAVVRGSTADVDRTLEVMDQVKGLPEADRAKQLRELSDSSGKDSKKFLAGEIPASEGVAKNLVNTGESQVVDLRELENSERRLKASQIFQTPADQTRRPIPKIDVRRPDEQELQKSTDESNLGKEVTINDTSIPALRLAREEFEKNGAVSPTSETDAKLAEAYAKSSKLERNLEETRKELSLEQAARRSAVPSPEAAFSTRGRETWGGKRAPQKQVALDEQSAKSEPFSTFSLHVSDVAFKLAQTALSQGQWPEAAKIRIEEFVNALDYHDPLPTGNQKVACRVEQAIHPFMMQRNLLRVSMRTAATGRAQNTPLRLTLLLDNSGSMERPDRRQAVLRAFQALTQQLSDKDQITLISFANTPRLLADKVPGNQGETLLQLVENLPSEGGTNIEAALMLAREKAAEQQVAGAQNRIVLLTDGAVNLGNANPESLAKLVTGMRDAGIAFDAAGISAQDLNDEVLEALTRQGDGRYYLLDSAESIGEKFASQIAGALRPSAQNVKVQVEFNPQRVGRYKLLGFEKHRLNKEDFRNDKVDAAEMAAAEAGVAVYQYEIKPNGTGDVGSVSVRFRDVSTGKMIENRWPIPYESNSPRLDQAEPSMQLAASAALLAAKLSGGPLGDSVDLTLLQKMLAKLPEQCTSQPRVQQLRTMVEQAIAIAK